MHLDPDPVIPVTLVDIGRERLVLAHDEWQNGEPGRINIGLGCPGFDVFRQLQIITATLAQVAFCIFPGPLLDPVLVIPFPPLALAFCH